MSNFSIHLSETLSDADAKRVAQQTAPALGGNPEKLHLLLSKQPGSRIARASSLRQAETVAGILRNAGVRVEVLESAVDSVVPSNKPAAPDPFAAPSIPPLPPSPEPVSVVSNSPKRGNEAKPPSLADEVMPPAMLRDAMPPSSMRDSTPPSSMRDSTPPSSMRDSTPPSSMRDSTPPSSIREVLASSSKSEAMPSLPELTAPVSDPFAAFKTSDPFAAPKSDPFSAPKSDPFATPKSDPFSAPKSDPFAAPKSDPFSAPKSDPFAAPVLRAKTELEVAVSPDPFAAPGTAVVIDTKATQTDLPPQARQARDRVMPRTSIERQMFWNLMIPIALVAVGVVAYMFYELPILYREELGRRAYQAARGEAEANFEFFKNLPDPATVRNLQLEADEDLKQIPEAVAIIYGSEQMKNSGQNGHVAAVASLPSVAMTPAEAKAIDDQFHAAEDSGEGFAIVTFRNKQYVGAVAEVEVEDNEKPESTTAGSTQETSSPESELGEVQVLFSLENIPSRVFNALIPLFVTLGVILLITLFVARGLALRLARPIIAATDQANRIALGDLDRSVNIESNDEIGDMLGSLERMRVSLKSMVARMRRNT
jgi:HAMP domain-containing protein